MQKGASTLRPKVEFIIIVGMSIALIGDVFVDIVTRVTSFDELKSSMDEEGDTLSSMAFLPGGSGLNSAFRVKELAPDMDVRFLSAVGQDQQGRMLENSLKEMDIGGVLLKDLPGGQTGSCIVLTSNAKRAFITQRGVIDTFKISDFTQAALRDTVLTSSHLHCAGFFNCGGLRPGERERKRGGQIGDLIDLFAEARAKSMTTSINPQDDANGNFIIPPKLLEVTTFLIGNAEEITKIAKAVGPADTTFANREDVAKTILGFGTSHVVITRGKEGAECFSTSSSGGDGLEVISQPGVDLTALGIEVIDTTGAGDSFIGGFLTEVVKNSGESTYPLERALRSGTLMGAHAATVNGGSTVSKSKLAHLRKASNL